MSKIFLLQAIQFSKTVLIQTIQFRISIHFSSILPIDRVLSGATTAGLWTWEWCWWRDAPHSPKLQYCWNSPSDCLVLYRLVGVLPSAEVQSVYSTAPAEWATWFGWELSCNHFLYANKLCVCSTFQNFRCYKFLENGKKRFHMLFSKMLKKNPKKMANLF